MALNIRNTKVERLAAEVAASLGVTKTEAIRQALKDRLETLRTGQRASERLQRMDRYLREQVWPFIPEDVRSKPVLNDEANEVLGYGPEGFRE